MVLYSLADPAPSPFLTCSIDEPRISSGETGGYELAFLTSPQGVEYLNYYRGASYANASYAIVLPFRFRIGTVLWSWIEDS
jgi:hypothetical protein